MRDECHSLTREEVEIHGSERKTVEEGRGEGGDRCLKEDVLDSGGGGGGKKEIIMKRGGGKKELILGEAKFGK